MANYSLPARSKYFSGKLYQQMEDDLHLAGMSQRTIHGYLRSVRQLADYCKKSPDKISEDQLRQFFLHLKNERCFAYGSMRVAYSGIKFFYTRTCKRSSWQTLATMKLQGGKTLPEVLTIKQVHRIIDACRTGRMAVYFWTVYSMGPSGSPHPRTFCSPTPARSRCTKSCLLIGCVALGCTIKSRPRPGAASGLSISVRSAVVRRC